MVKIYFSTLLFVFHAFSGLAQDFYSGPAGNWCSHPNGKGDCINSISDKDNLIVDREISLNGLIEHKGSIEILETGKLNIQSGDFEISGKLSIKKGGILNIQNNLMFKNKVEVAVENEAFIVVGGNFMNANNSDNVVLHGVLEIGGNFENGNNAEIKGSGKINIAGGCTNNGSVFNVQKTCIGINNLALPVEILSFKADIESNQVNLEWSTASEDNFDFFTVERSPDAFNFNAIGNPIYGEGRSTSIKRYKFSDDIPLTGRSYYRLKATDLDGSVEYHPVISITLQSETSFKVYPNPSQGKNLSLVIDSEVGSRSTFKIYNIIGEEVFKAPLQHGTNDFSFEAPLKAGLYVIIVDNGLMKKQAKITVE